MHNESTAKKLSALILKTDKYVKAVSTTFWESLLKFRLLPKPKNTGLEFLSEADRIEAEPINQNYPVTLYAILLFLITGLVWAAFSPLDQVVSGPGKIISVEQNIVLQSQDTAEIKEVNVSVGQVVKKGDTLFVLDPTIPQADLTQARGSYEGVILALDISRKEILTIEARIRNTVEIEDMTKQLVDRNFQSKRALIEQREKRLELEQSLIAAKAKQNDLLSQKTIYEQQLVKAKRKSELIRIIAPRDGVILELSTLTRGSVARAAEPIVTLVPTDVPMIAEVTIDPSNISGVSKGKRVKIKLDAFPFQRYGFIEGIVNSVTPDAIPSKTQNGRTNYIARIIFDQAAHTTEILGNVKPGMTLVGEVITDRRTVLEYMFDPLLKIKMEALNEK